MQEFVRYRKLNASQHKSKVELLVSGFGYQQLVPVDDIVDAVMKLPQSHIQKIQVIKFDPNKNISFLLRHQRVGPQLGEYLLNYKSIVVYQFNSRHECFHVLFHEVGHHVYFQAITSFQKKEWVTEVYPAEPGVTPLGKKNACEDFAESYALYVNEPNRLKPFVRKYRFIDSLFKNVN